ncbi:MAG: hypothetical protein IJ453_03920 [Oscillospiraceae bacterium]|nr:hypothetical protein [Oscillospiraceae bacterium]
MKNVIDLTPYLAQDVVLAKPKRRIDLSVLTESIVSVLLGGCIISAFAIFFAVI